jgi:hypothetical protein
MNDVSDAARPYRLPECPAWCRGHDDDDLERHSDGDDLCHETELDLFTVEEPNDPLSVCVTLVTDLIGEPVRDLYLYLGPGEGAMTASRTRELAAFLLNAADKLDEIAAKS